MKNYNNSESNSFGISLSLGFKANDPSASQNSQSAQNTKGVVPGNLNLNLALQGSESSSNTKATIGRGIININNTATDSTTSGLNRNVTNTEQNKKTVITSNFSTNLSIDTRLITAGAASLASALGIDSTDKIAASNWGSYKGDTMKGAKILGYSLHIPALSIYSYASQTDLTASDALYATAKNYDILYHLAYNPNITATDFAGKGTLISYNANQLDQNSDAASAEGFYDRKTDVVSINIDSNITNAELAGKLVHEGGVHRDFNLSGKSYTTSEEIAAHLVGDFTKNAWNNFQSNNTTFRTSIPASTFNTNSYANGVVFGENVNPYEKDVHQDLTYFLAKNAGFTRNEAQIIAKSNQGVDENPNTEPLFAGRTARKDYHFTTSERREEMLDASIMSDNLEGFGQYLHAFQDSFSHQIDGKPFQDMFGHLDLGKPFSGLGKDIDKTYNRPDLADEMAVQTYQKMQQFLSLRNHQQPMNNWHKIQNTVQLFNRLRIEDENKKGVVLRGNQN